MVSAKSAAAIALLACFAVALPEYFILSRGREAENLEMLQVHITIVDASENTVLKENILFMPPGSTAFDALVKVASVQYAEYPGMGVFVQAIDNLSTTDQKWWLYRVNGSYPNVSASRLVLENGDNVVWEYTSFFPSF